MGDISDSNYFRSLWEISRKKRIALWMENTRLRELLQQYLDRDADMTMARIRQAEADGFWAKT